MNEFWKFRRSHAQPGMYQKISWEDQKRGIDQNTLCIYQQPWRRGETARVNQEEPENNDRDEEEYPEMLKLPDYAKNGSVCYMELVICKNLQKSLEAINSDLAESHHF